jgi:putative membrane protein
MKVAAVIGLLAGALLIVLLVGHYGVAGILRALTAIGWTGFAAILTLHVILIGIMGLAWWVVVPQPGTRPALFMWGRLVRDSASEVLPLSQVGGYVAGAVAVARAGVPFALSAASTIVDVTAELIAQLAYTALGLVLLDRLRPDNGFARPVLLGLAAMTALVLAFLVVQRRGIRLPARLTLRLSRGWLSAFGGLAATQGHLHAMHARRDAVALCGLIHLATWIGSGLEIWLALRFMGIELGVASVLALESLLYGARSVAFLVPNAVGVQEGAYVALGAVLGLSPEAALALSLLKRGRDLAIGVPALLVWQAIEGRRALRRLDTVAPIALADPNKGH